MRRDVAGRQEDRVVGIDDGPQRLGRRRGARQVEQARGSGRPSRPACSQARMHSCSSHRPITLRRYLTVPSTPASLVKLARLLSSVSTGASSSIPASDQVPEEM